MSQDKLTSGLINLTAGQDYSLLSELVETSKAVNASTGMY